MTGLPKKNVCLLFPWRFPWQCVSKNQMNTLHLHSGSLLSHYFSCSFATHVLQSICVDTAATLTCSFALQDPEGAVPGKHSHEPTARSGHAGAVPQQQADYPPPACCTHALLQWYASKQNVCCHCQALPLQAAFVWCCLFWAPAFIGV